MESEAKTSDEGAGERAELLDTLREQLDMPIISVVAGWEGNNVVNLDEEAARAFLSVLDAELAAREKRPKAMGLFLVGRGGFASFADGVSRALEGRDLAMHVIVPYRSDGAFSLLGLAAKRCLMHPYGALGAYDRRPLGRLSGRLNSELVGELEAPAGQVDEGDPLLTEIAAERVQRRLARRLMERLVGGADSKLGKRVAKQMSAETLGSELALSPAELESMGLPCRRARDEVADTIWRLYRAYERELGVLEPPTPRFTESEVADEVEFNPAVGLCGALIEGRAQQMRFELDTGSPDPDTNMLTGQWLWERSEN